MAVRHGYGKVAGANSLVFAYDTGDTRNSYKGEPTINLVSNPIIGEYGNAPGSTTNIISPDGTNNATVPIPDANADRYQKTIAGGLYSSGTQFTYSWHYKQLAPHAGSNQPSGLSVTGLVNCSLVGSVTKMYDLSNEWSRWKATFQITDGSLESIFRLYFGSVIGINGSSAAYYGHQFEQKSYATPFVNGTRSSTQGLLDLKGNSTIDLANVSFNANAQMTFDGTDDRIVVPYSGTDLNGDPLFTVEGIFKRTGASMSGKGFWGIGGDNTAQGINAYTYNGSGNEVAIDLWGSKTYRTGVDYPLNQYVHVVWVKSAPTFTVNTIAIYINGVEYTGASLIVNRDDAATVNLNTSTSGKGICIGRVGPQTNNYYGVGEVPVFKVYNRALTADEVRNNFRQYKGRFNI